MTLSWSDVLQEVSVGPPGGVVLGEQGQASFTIFNEGALEVQFDVQRSDALVGNHSICYMTLTS